MALSKAKATLQESKRALSNYKFDTSNYIVFSSGIRRDAHTGKLMMHSSQKKTGKQRQK